MLIVDLERIKELGTIKADYKFVGFLAGKLIGHTGAQQDEIEKHLPKNEDM